MACFLVPAAEAIVAGAVKKAADGGHISGPGAAGAASEDRAEARASFSEKLGWLVKMLTGGSVLLAFEHLWHGEVVPFFPFLTAMEDAGETAEMLHEMGTVGVAMAVLITMVWIGMVLVSNMLESRAADEKGRGLRA